jgi:hypothetical protein
VIARLTRAECGRRPSLQSTPEHDRPPVRRARGRAPRRPGAHPT